MDSPGDSALARDLESVMEELNPQELPLVLRDSGQERNAVQLVEMKKVYNATAELDDPQRTRAVLDGQIPAIQEMRARAKDIADAAPAERRKEAEEAFQWFNEMANKYLKDLRKQAKGEPRVIEMHKKERSISRALSREPASSSTRRAPSRAPSRAAGSSSSKK
jgi:vacuolar-type H+-ATPase subunit H